MNFFPLDGQLFCEKVALLIKQKRLDRHLRQSDLANAVQSSVSTIKRMERGDTTVEYGIVIKVLWYLGILDELHHVLPSIDDEIQPKRVRLVKVHEDDF